MNSPQDTLARTIWGEARGEGPAGMHAVANVVLNRAAKPGWWGRDVSTVCQKPWQFSCWNAKDPNREQLLSVTLADKSFVMAQQIAAQALSGTLSDITKGATYYYASAIDTPEWAEGLQPCAVIGHQLFFNNVT